MFTGIMAYLAAGAGIVAALSIGVNVYQGSRIDTLKSEATVKQVELAACGSRLANLVEDIQSDNGIDALSDDDLRSVPDNWLQPGTTD